MAIAFHPKFEYVAVEVAGDVYIVAADLLEGHGGKVRLGGRRSRSPASPAPQLERAVFRHPFLDRDSLGILADHVTLEQGTGAVHTAPGHGQEDYVVGRQYGIATYCPVDAAGRFFHAEGAAGTPARRTDRQDGLGGESDRHRDPAEHTARCSAQEKIEHSYPHCWRCHNPTIFRATEQWFIGMERNDLRQGALEACSKVKWMPAWGEERISNMIATRPDWCISRQRVWGVPIIVFYCEPVPRAAHRSQDPRPRRRAVRRAHRRRLVRAHAPPN